MRIQNLVLIFCASLVCTTGRAQVTSAGIGSTSSVPPPSAPVNTAPCTRDANDPQVTPCKGGIITDTQGVDFKPYMAQIYHITQSSWTPLIPRNAQAPFNESGVVTIRFTLLPNGHLKKGSFVMEEHTSDSAMDRAAQYAIMNSVYPPLPKEFGGPELELRFGFLYNMDRKPTQTKASRQIPTLVDMVGGLFGYKSRK